MFDFYEIGRVFIATILDVLPIVAIILFFQLLVIRKNIPNPSRAMLGVAYVIFGLTFFLVGLEQALFPLGKLMAAQLTDPAFINPAMAKLMNMSKGSHSVSGLIVWQEYMWVYLFAAAIGFATTIAEPALLAVAIKARAVSGGAVSIWGLRIAVGTGVALGLAIGTFRIVTGTPLQYYIMVGYIVVIVQTFFAPKMIIALAYDSGGVTTSTVTVPLVTALGLGLASTIPGRSTLLDGFGLIAFASLFPIITVMAYAMFVEWLEKRNDAARVDKGE
ncbi:MAG: DUF1538 domain-containing protein [Thiohalomonadales bacterium]